MSLCMRSTLAGQSLAFKPATMQTRVARVLTVDAKRVCELTGKKRNKANAVCFSNKKNRKWQEPNLQQKKVFWEEGQRWVRLRICTKAIKTLEKNGINLMAAEANIDLWKLPFEDARPQRKAFLAENQGKVPVAVNPRAMKNAEKLAASKKQPKYPVYEEGGRIVFIRPGMEDTIFGKKEGAVAAAEAQELKITLTE
ncbi:50S ribosomal protein L28, chloroplastic [Tetrabaena socialis]|uniref:Large ribosomal subunit protein bL28c n=1 Tax=Tetrabaena socialis TaxID=47790 RepID=A0A2J8A0Q2_9CHLO|nr:50S ribosomal protein L28, chloroplastic [Tetrabaena socialis]|eukprot:PNH06100.1 50S ribosomal protein L28, chloroplastic [Tetrabaena socialis]